MRIIAGSLRRRALLSPEDSETTRPILDRVKENLFNRLMAMDLPSGDDDTYVLDIFSGTGSLGIEAMSRGSDHCTFVENDHKARNLLERNLVDLRLADRATVLSVDALGLNWLSLLPPKMAELIFCDPPYALTRDPQTANHIRDLIEVLATHAEPGAALIMRTEESVTPPPAANWHEPQTYRYGTMAVHVYARSE